MSAKPRIHVYCPSCAVVRVRPRDVTLRNCLDDDRWEYRFRCPTCKKLALGHSERGLALEAYAAGAALEHWHLPAELDEPHQGPPINGRDVFEFRLRLDEADDWLGELAGAPKSGHQPPPIV